MPMRVNLAHHWIMSIRGGEKVLDQFCKLFPDAEISTLVTNPARWEPWVHERRIRTSFLQRLPASTKLYKHMLPLFPIAASSLTVPGDTELLLSSDAAVVKGLKLPTGAKHVCYCHSPPRYLWDQQDTYLQQTSGLGGVGKMVFRSVSPYVRNFDRQAAERVDHFIANSHFVASRIQRVYGRESVVIHPPVAIDDFRADQSREDYYLIVSELAPYKRVDLAVEACSRMNRKLVVIGSGSERKRLERIAGPNVQLLGSQPFSVLRQHFERCRAFIFPGVEDFGIAPLEAMAAGAPVIAFGQGGALETVLEGRSGLFFHKQTCDALCQTIKEFEAGTPFDPQVCRARAAEFSPEQFRQRILNQLHEWFPNLRD